MKKIIITILAIALSVAFTSCRVATPIVATTQGCNQNAPGWGNRLGRVSFYTDNEWVIEGNGITQIWSDAVTARACRKAVFSGSSLGDFNADCRSNPGFPGDLFSWCAVVRFAEILCPYPWRVPTVQDFIDLDIAMGGTGKDRDSEDYLEFINANYINRWGGALGGDAKSDGALWIQGLWGNYWSLSEGCASSGHGLYFSVFGNIYPQGWVSKSFGFSLRCIR